MELKIMICIIQFLFLILVFGQDNLSSKSPCLGNCLTCNVDQLSKCSGEQYIGCVKGYSGASCDVNYGNQIILFDPQNQKIPIGWKNDNIFTCFYNNSQNQEIKVHALGIYLQFDSNQVIFQVQPWFQNYIINFNLIRDAWSPYSDLLRVVTYDEQQNQINQKFIEFLQRDTIDPNKNKLRCDNQPFIVQKYQFEGILEQNLKKMILKFEGMMFSQAKWAISNIRIAYGCSNFILYDGASCQACHKGYYPVRTTNNVVSRCNICPINCKQCKQSNICVKCSQGFNLINGQCANNNSNLVYAVPQRNLSCTSNTLRISKNEGSVEKIQLSIQLAEHTKIRVQFYLFYVISKQIQKGSINVSINGKVQVQVNGQQLYKKRYPNQKCKSFGASTYYSIIRLDTKYLEHESNQIQLVILGENIQKFGIEEVFVQYQAKNVEQTSVSIAKFVQNKQNKNSSTEVNQSRLLEEKKEDVKIQQQREQKMQQQKSIQIKPQKSTQNSQSLKQQIQKKQQKYEQVKYSSIKVNHTEKVDQKPQQTKVQQIKSQHVSIQDQADVNQQEKSEQINRESVSVKSRQNKQESEKIVQYKRAQTKTQKNKLIQLKLQDLKQQKNNYTQQNYSENIDKIQNKSQSKTDPDTNANANISTTKQQQIQTMIGINKVGTRIQNIQKILTIKQKIILNVKYSEQLIITINYPVKLTQFPYIVGHLSKKNLTIVPKVSYQTTNYQELTFNIKQSLLDEILLLKMLSQNPIKTNQRLLQAGASNQLGKINVYRYDYLTKEERDQIKKFSIVFEVFAWFAIISSILLTFFASGVLVQQFVITLQIIFMHLYLFSQYLPINFRLALGGLKRIQNLNYFLTDVAAQIQNLLLGNVTQISPQRFTMFKKDINFTRAIYPCIIIIFCYLIVFLILKLIKNFLQPKLYQKKESINQKQSKIKLFIIRVAQRSMSFWYQIWQYQYITFIWAGCLQLHNLSYPQASNRYDLPNSMFCILCLVLGLGLPIITYLYLNRKYDDLGYFNYCYLYENIFYMKLPDQKLASRYHRFEIIVKNLRYIIICVSIAFIGEWPLVALIILVLLNLFSIFFTSITHIQVNKINEKLNTIEYLLLMFLQSAILLAYGTSISLQKDTYLIIGYVLTALCLGLIFFALVRIFYYVYHKIFWGRVGERVNFKHPQGTGTYF